jgi:retinol dehydrogenase 12
MTRIPGLPSSSPTPPFPSSSYASQTVLITGASAGIGVEAARHYVRLGASKVILGIRSITKGEAVKHDIEQTTGRKGVVEIWEVDYDSFSSVREFATRVKAELKCLDIAILNAGVSKAAFELSPEGWEESIQVNVLSTVLLALLLLPVMQSLATKEWTPRMVIVASGTHARIKDFPQQDAPNILEALNKPESFGPMQARYALSKLLVIYATREIAKLALGPKREPNVIVTYLCPGGVISDLGRDYDTVFFSVVKWFFYTFVTKSTEEGSRSYLAASDLGKEAHGKYYKFNKIDA